MGCVPASSTLKLITVCAYIARVCSTPEHKGVQRSQLLIDIVFYDRPGWSSGSTIIDNPIVTYRECIQLMLLDILSNALLCRRGLPGQHPPEATYYSGLPPPFTLWVFNSTYIAEYCLRNLSAQWGRTLRRSYIPIPLTGKPLPTPDQPAHWTRLTLPNLTGLLHGGPDRT